MGVGANELQWTYENHPNFSVIPLFAHALCYKGTSFGKSTIVLPSTSSNDLALHQYGVITEVNTNTDTYVFLLSVDVLQFPPETFAPKEFTELVPGINPLMGLHGYQAIEMLQPMPLEGRLHWYAKEVNNSSLKSDHLSSYTLCDGGAWWSS